MVQWRRTYSCVSAPFPLLYNQAEHGYQLNDMRQCGRGYHLNDTPPLHRPPWLQNTRRLMTLASAHKLSK